MEHFKKYIEGSGLDVHMEYQEKSELIAFQVLKSIIFFLVLIFFLFIF